MVCLGFVLRGLLVTLRCYRHRKPFLRVVYRTKPNLVQKATPSNLLVEMESLELHYLSD